MKIRKLYFFAKAYVGSTCTAVDTVTHDIVIGGPGYVVTERRSMTSYLVHAATCTAELEKDGEELVPAGKAKKGAPVAA